MAGAAAWLVLGPEDAAPQIRRRFAGVPPALRTRSAPVCTLHRAPVGQGSPGPDWLAIFFWVLVWTGACYWHGVGGFMFNPSSSPCNSAFNFDVKAGVVVM